MSFLKTIDRIKKQFLDEAQLVLDAFKLGVTIFESGFRPDFVVGLWRGGSTIGIYVQECLQTLRLEVDHLALITSYQGATNYETMISRPASLIQVHGASFLVNSLEAQTKLLIVDDVFSSGLNIQAVLQRLQKKLRRNMPLETKIAALYQRPHYRKVDFSPDYCLHETNNWLVFPYEMNGLSVDEIKQYKPYLDKMLVTKSASKS